MSTSTLRKQQMLLNSLSNKGVMISRHAPTSKLVNYMNLQSNAFSHSNTKLITNTKTKAICNKTCVPSISAYNSKQSLNETIVQMKKTILFPLNTKHNKTNSTFISQRFADRIDVIASKKKTSNNNKPIKGLSGSSSISQYKETINANANANKSKDNRFLNRSQELIDLIQKPSMNNSNRRKTKMKTLIANTKQSHFLCSCSPNKNVCDINTHADFFDNKCLNKSASFQKLNHMQKVLNKSIKDSNSNDNNYGGEILSYYYKENNFGSNGKKELFNTTFQRRLKNKMHDLKKFKFFINYQERKDNQEKRAEFIANNLTIIGNIKEKVVKAIPAEEEEIDIDDLIE